jgi:hypothetical protein
VQKFRRKTTRKPIRRKGRFRGEKDDTRPIDVHTTRSGREYIERINAPLYPKLTTIPVSQSTKNAYFILRGIGRYNNYDELLLDLVEEKVRDRELKISSRLNKSHASKLVLMLDKMMTRIKQDIRFRELSREKAMKKGRYRPR